MKKQMYWGLAALIILLGTATVWIILHERAEFAQLERESAKDDNLLPKSDRSPQQTPPQAGMSTSTPKPPPGETHDTGHWDGNTWHKTTPPKPKKKWVWSRELDIHEYRDKLSEADDEEQFMRSIIQKQPYSQAALQARLAFARGSVDLKAALKYHPESPLLLSELALGTMFRYPEESVAFAKKALRLLPTTSEDYSNRMLWHSPAVSIHKALGKAYQKLGDYKAALVHLKTVQSLLKPGIGHPWNASSYKAWSEDIAAIEAGKPRLGPDPKPQPASDFSVFPGQPGSPVEPVAVSEQTSSVGSFDFPTVPPDSIDFAPANPSLVPSDKSVRAAEAVQQARADFARQQQQEFGDFLRWMERIEQAKSPAELDNFLMREMAKQLQGGEAQFTPDRLIRAFETFNRHGDTEGLTQLQKIDPDIARAMSRQRPNKHVPPRTAPVRPKTTVHNPK